jgi:hypothetical protein
MSSAKHNWENASCGPRLTVRGGSRRAPSVAGPNPKAALVVLFTCVAACASTPKVIPNVEGAAEELPQEEVYFPLRDGHIYQYTVQGQDGRPGFLITKVARTDEAATLTTGERVTRLTVRGDGIYNDSGYYLLKLPLKVGAEWSGQRGVVSVVRVGQSVETGAGKFVECVVTREVTQGTVEIRTVETTFCPNVGLVRLEVTALGEELTEVELATLQYYGPPIDVNAL